MAAKGAEWEPLKVYLSIKAMKKLTKIVTICFSRTLTINQRLAVTQKAFGQEKQLRRPRDDQQAHEKVLNVTTGQGTASKNLSEISLHIPVRMAIIRGRVSLKW